MHSNQPKIKKQLNQSLKNNFMKKN